MQQWQRQLSAMLPGAAPSDAAVEEKPAAATTPTEPGGAPVVGGGTSVTEQPPAAPIKPVAQATPQFGQWCAKLTQAKVALKPGDKGDKVKALQELLTHAGFYRNPVSGAYNAHTSAAVVAFHKAHDQPRTAAWRKADWQTLCAYTAPTLPERKGSPDRLEIDLDRQVLYLIKQNRVQAVMPVSSGNGKPYQEEKGNWVKATTPLGDYSIGRFYNGWRTSYLGELYRPWYFHGGYAVHGSPSVPPTPASHGCVRVTMWDADYLADQLAIGMPVHIWKKDRLAQAQ